ncbi:hypothetical protein V7150_25035 [Neobacillus drentensis]|uniref:hypothetical protein n=1 Tax=Neobacillus drentensis TaxID=220684 RepID=UPI002FFE584B
MKLDDKRKKIQLKYRQKIKQQAENHKNHRKETAVIAVVLILIVLLSIFFNDIFNPKPDRIIKIE